MESQTQPEEIDADDLVLISQDTYWDDVAKRWIFTWRATTNKDLTVNFNPGTTFTLYAG